jgi:outer membrane protein assembly factor BamB
MRRAAALVAILVLTLAPGGEGVRAATRSSFQPAGARAAVGGSWLTYHADSRRTGVDRSSPPLHSVHRAWTSPNLYGAIYAEPLVHGTRVFVATENDSVYALSAGTGHIIWRRHVGTPVPLSELSCGNIDPNGITGTPVIDAGNGTLYAVAFVQPGVHQLVAINISTGRLKWRRRADPSGVDPKIHQERGALVIANGRVYAPYGGFSGDCGSYHGRVISRRLNGSGMISYKVPSQREAGIWATSGVAVDATGHPVVATGNSSSSGAYDFGNATIRLSPTLKKIGFFAPSNWKSLNAGDTDLGSIGPSILPNGLIFQGGKEGAGYLLHQKHLGGIGGAAFAKSVCSSMWGGTAFAAGRVFVPCGDGLYALRIKAGPSFSIPWHSASFNAGPPIVAGGAVWTIDIDSGVLHAFVPGTGHQILTRSVGPVEHFTSPTAAAGKLYVAATNHLVAFAGI